MDKLIQELKECWDPDNGFLGRLRDGYFSVTGYEKTLELLRRIAEHPDARQPILDRHLVRQLWYIPHYMTWQKDRLVENRQIEPQEYDNVCDAVLNELTEILEVP